MPRIDDILAGVIKGAQEAGARVEMLSLGQEEKLAGLGGAAGSLAGPLGSAAGAGLQDKNWGSAAGAGAGALLGGAAGTALGGMAGRSIGELIDADPHLSQTVGSILGMLGGGAAGGHLGQNALRPEKQANLAGLGGGLGAVAGHYALPPELAPLLAGIGGAAGADNGQRMNGAAGAIGGGLLGQALGGLAGNALHAPGLGKALGGIGGAALGGHALGHNEGGLLDKIRGKFSSAEDAYLAGSAKAARQYKVAIAPIIGGLASMAAGPLLRMGAGRLGAKAGGGALGRIAGGVNRMTKGPVGGAVFDAGASMAAQSAMS
jgi:hypothetical protein